jgi:uncharacterized coiled-coil protein SlyX
MAYGWGQPTRDSTPGGTSTRHGDRVSWWQTFTAPWRTAPKIERAVTVTIPARLTALETLMAADRDLLAEIASGLTLLATPISDLIASEAALRARVAELEGDAAADEAGDLEAAGAVKTAFDVIADKFRSEPEVPDVEPIPDPEPEQPADS